MPPVAERKCRLIAPAAFFAAGLFAGRLPEPAFAQNIAGEADASARNRPVGGADRAAKICSR